MASRSLLRFLQKGKFKSIQWSAYAYQTAASAPSQPTLQQELLDKRKLSVNATANLPEYSEDFLTELYDALQLPAPPTAAPKSLPQSSLDEHLALLGQRLDEEITSQDYKSLLERLEASIAEAEAQGPVTLPVALATQEELLAIIKSAIEADDGPSVLRCLALAVRSAHPASTSLYESASDACASSSNPSLAFDVVEQFQRLGQPTLAMHHGLIKAYITAEDVIAAQKHLRKMEQTSITPAQQSYRLVIQALLRDSTPQAWNLFAHMRLVAHPVPDAETYDLMIDACGNVRDPSPERAADLLAEMQEHRLQPTGNTYLGLIKACSRTFRDGKTPFYFQAIEYFRQMLAAGLTPTRDTLHALLMGSRIVGDLDRAYFIFNRMLAAGLQDDIAVNAQTVALLFDTYANYKLPERRALKVQAEQAEVEEVSAGENLLGSSEAEEIEALQNEEADVKVALPETASEVRGQLRTLMARLLAAHDKDYKAIFPEQDIDAVTLPSQLRSIHLAPSLLNSFLRAHMRFSTFEQQVPVMTALFNISDQQINGQTFKVMMKACAAAHDKAAGREEAQRIFTEWKEWAESKPLRTTAARSVWLTYVHVLARDNLAKEAYQELCAFYKLLPPSLIIDHAVQTVKAANLAPRPSVTLADDSYPETTSQHWQSRGFDQKDIVMLRKRMSDAENKTAIRKIKHMLKGYRDAEREAAAILKAGRVVNVPAKPTT